MSATDPEPSAPDAAPIPLSRKDLARALWACGYAAYQHALSGRHLSPALRAYYDRVTNPQPGDWVCETTTIGFRDQSDSEHAVGILITRGEETLRYREQPEETYLAYVWRVRGLDGVERAWTNAEFIALPRDVRETWKFFGRE